MALSSSGAQGTRILQGVIWHLPRPRPNHPIPAFLSWARTRHLEHRILLPWKPIPEEQLGTFVALLACGPIALSPLPSCSVAGRVGLERGQAIVRSCQNLSCLAGVFLSMP